MKTCPACGLHIEDDYLYCWEDGTRLTGGETLLLPQRPTAPMTSDEQGAHFPPVEAGADEQRVLSCQICGGEFPLTFTVCPVHDLPLTSKRVSRQRTLARASAAVVEPIAQVMVCDEAILPNETVEESEVYLADEPLSTEGEQDATSPEMASTTAHVRWSDLRDRARTLWQRIGGGRLSARVNANDRRFGWAASVESHDADPPPVMRLAARAIAIALGLFTVGAIYIFYRQVTRPTSRSTHAVAVQGAAVQMEPPLIATPPEAREYRDEPAPTAQASTDEGASGQSPQKETPPVNVSGDAAAPRTSAPPTARSTPAIQPNGTSDSVTLPASGRFNAELVRVRSYRAASGYSYSLTFTLYEHAGRPMKWERLSIVTHSAGGATHTDMLPFQRWLAGSGALTFTVNVDMVGGSEADWRGRVSCMSVGTDETGRPLRASFGTNVAP